MNSLISGTISKLAMLVVAPKSLTIRFDVTDLSTGDVMRKGKAFFTYEEFEALRKQNHIPAGCRLPTLEEAEKLIREFAGDEMTSQRFIGELHLGYGGYVYPRMKQYNEDPTEFSEAIENRYLEGRYWVEDPHDGSLYVIWVHRHKAPTIQAVCPSSGAKVRLVYNI